MIYFKCNVVASWKAQNFFLQKHSECKTNKVIESIRKLKFEKLKKKNSENNDTVAAEENIGKESK